MDGKQLRIYEILRAAIDTQVEIKGTLGSKKVVFCSSVGRTTYGKQVFNVEFRNITKHDEEPDYIYFSSTSRLIKNDSSKKVILDDIESIQVVFE